MSSDDAVAEPAGSQYSLHVESLGPIGAPVIVFLHGLAGSTASWGMPFRELAADHRLLLVDLLGFGRSPKPAIGYTLGQHISALEATLQQQGALRAHLVGHSMGALLALAFAAHQPARVKILTLLALPWYGSAVDARQHIAKQSLFNRWLALETPMAQLACTAMCCLGPWLMPLMPRLLRDVPPQVAQDVLRHNWLSYSRTLQHLIIEDQPGERLRQVQGPVLFIQGQRVDTARVVPVQRGIVQEPSATLEIVDAGHHLVFSHASELTERLGTFFDPNHPRPTA